MASISDEAFKAADNAYMETLTDLRLKEGGGFKVGSQNKRALRAAFEAAAPYLMAQAWAEGHEDGFWNGRLSHGDLQALTGIEHAKAPNPYRSQA